MLSFSISLVCWYDDIQMQFILFTLNHLRNSLFHLTNQINVQLAVKLIALILPKSLYLFALAKVFPNYSNNSLLHLFFQDVVLSLRVNFI
jgi:hypothetical protein